MPLREGQGTDFDGSCRTDRKSAFSSSRLIRLNGRELLVAVKRKRAVITDNIARHLIGAVSDSAAVDNKGRRKLKSIIRLVRRRCLGIERGRERAGNSGLSDVVVIKCSVDHTAFLDVHSVGVDLAGDAVFP